MNRTITQQRGMRDDKNAFQPLRILYLGRYQTEEIFRGPEKVARRIADELAAAGHDVHFCEYFFSGEEYSWKQKLFGREILAAASGIDLQRLGLVPCMILLLRGGYDILHIITFERFALLAIILKVLIRRPIVFTIHGIVAHEESTFRRSTRLGLRLKDGIAEWLFFRFSDRLMFLSDQSMEIAARFYRFSRRKTVLVSNGLDAAFLGPRLDARSSHPGATIVFNGDPSRAEKGFAFFLRALERCREHGEIFVICESVPIPEIRMVNGFTVRFIRKMATEAYVTLLSGMDIYIGASACETFSIAAIEAMGSGLAPIVTRQTGMSRLITSGINGFVVEYDDDEDLARQIDRLVADETLRTSISCQARSICQTLLWENIAKEYIGIYRLLFDPSSSITQ